jgi:hypothetical protein
MKQKIKRVSIKKVRKGSALLLTTILLFVILSMVVSLSYVTVMEQKMSQKTKSSVGSFFNADSGVEWALNKIASSNNSATINTISGLTFNADGSVQCPFGGCNVYFLKQDGTTIKPAELGTLTINDIKAVRSVGSDPNQTTQRAIEAAVAQSAANVPPGGIIMWSGTLATVPTGWALCDGTNGTPDLRDKFVWGVSSSQDPVQINWNSSNILAQPSGPSGWSSFALPSFKIAFIMKL